MTPERFKENSQEQRRKSARKTPGKTVKKHKQTHRQNLNNITYIKYTPNSKAELLHGVLATNHFCQPNAKAADHGHSSVVHLLIAHVVVVHLHVERVVVVACPPGVGSFPPGQLEEAA